MIFEQLVLHNFGAYHGEHVISLGVTPDKPIVLVGALNGSGKTTLLEATQLALFGHAVRSTSRNKMSYPTYLEQLINRNVSQEVGARVALTFRHRRAGEDETFTISRNWRRSGAGIKEHIEVFRDGSFDSEATERWLEFVQEFLPVQLADLFLFDGERIEALADPESSREFLRAGIHALLGLDLVDHLVRTLGKHEDRLRTEPAADQKPRELLARAESEKAALEVRRAELMKEIGEADSDVLAAGKALERARQAFTRQGGDLHTERDRIKAALTDAEKKLAASAEVLRDEAAGDAPLLLVGDLLEEANALAEQCRTAHVAATIYAAVCARDKKLRKLLSDAKTSKKLQDEVARFLDSSAQKWKPVAEQIPTSDLRAVQFDFMQDEHWKNLKTRLRKARAHFSACKKDTQSALTRWQAVPPEESVRAALEELIQAEEAWRQAVAILEVRKQERGRICQLLDPESLVNKRIEAASAEVRKLDLKDEVDERVVKHSRKARETLAQFRQQVAAKNLQRLETLITERFLVIARKRDGLVSAVRIDPTKFDLVLLDRQGRVLDPLLLSAGERQLLAVAIVWALAMASGRSLPTIIDTPLGRLDGEHRAKLVEEYFPRASHQVILLSTDEEINGKYYARLQPHLAREYRLEFDPATRSSSIEPGYFPQTARAVA